MREITSTYYTKHPAEKDVVKEVGLRQFGFSSWTGLDRLKLKKEDGGDTGLWFVFFAML